MKSITIRGIDPALDRVIKSRAKQNNLSVNQWVVQTLKKVTGTGEEPVFKKHHDLDALAGGWSKEEVRAWKACCYCPNFNVEPDPSVTSVEMQTK
jgi:hypothetical protein